MTKEASVKVEMVVSGVTSEIVSSQTKKEKIDSADELCFVKQQASNLKIKETMAEELREMELPDYVVNEILNIEDEVPF